MALLKPVCKNDHFYFSIEDLMKVKKENKDLWEEIVNLNEFGILKQASSSSTLWFWAVEQRKLWNAQALIIRQTETIDGLEEGVCSLLEHNMCLERSVVGFGLMHTTKRNMFLIKLKRKLTTVVNWWFFVRNQLINRCLIYLTNNGLP